MIYPFLPRYKKEVDLSLNDVPVELLEIAFDRVKAALNGKLALFHGKYSEKAIILSFPIAKILGGLSPLKRKYAAAERDFYFSQLLLEDEEKIKEMVEELFGPLPLPVEIVLNYLPKGRRLVELDVEKGKVFLEKEDLAGILAVYVEKSILDLKIRREDVPKLFLYWVDQIKIERREEVLPIDVDAFPPCMKKIITDLKSGIKVAHYPRFYLAAFLAQINFDIDKAIDFFRNQPNFDEKRTRYYLEHAFGMRGGRKRYRAPSCSRLRAEGLCVEDCGVSSPYTYYKRAVKRKKSENQKKF